MALTFFWRCEGTTLDGTHDYSAGDTTASLINSGSIDASAVRVGTNGLLRPSSVSGGATFSPSGILPGSASTSVGSMGFSLRSVGSVTNTSGITIQRFIGTSTSNFIDVQYGGDGTTSATNLRFRIGNGSTKVIALTGDALTPDAWFGVVARWDIPGDKMRLELYNSSGTLVDSVEDTATDLSTYAPSELASQFLCGAGRASDAWATYVDNVFVADTYDELIQDNFTITSYTSYDGSGLVKYLKILTDSSAASATGVEVVAFSAPSGSNYVAGTTRYGSANGKAFEASLESGQAVLKVLASDVGCDSLAVSTTLRALAQNTTYTTGMVEATIIEE